MIHFCRELLYRKLPSLTGADDVHVAVYITNNVEQGSHVIVHHTLYYCTSRRHITSQSGLWTMGQKPSAIDSHQNPESAYPTDRLGVGRAFNFPHNVFSSSFYFGHLLLLIVRKPISRRTVDNFCRVEVNFSASP